METTAAVTTELGGGFDVQPVVIGEPREDEILVKITGVGLCHTDLAFSTMAEAYKFPAVFGHEGAGIVEKVGAKVTKVNAGDHVVISFRSCAACDRCDAGDTAYCRSFPILNFVGGRSDGSTPIQGEDGPITGNFFGQSSFAGYALTYETNVVAIDKTLPLEMLGPLGCGIQTGVGSIMRSLDAEAGSSVLILGGGTVGLAAVMGAKIRNCKDIIVVEPQQSRRDIATELGATLVIDPKEAEDFSAVVREVLPNGVDYALDTTGVPSVLTMTMAALGAKGVFGIVGTCPPDTPVPGNLLSVINFGQTIKGIIEGDSDPDEFIPDLIDYYSQGKLPIEKLIQTYPLSKINDAINDQKKGKCVKAILLPHD